MKNRNFFVALFAALGALAIVLATQHVDVKIGVQTAEASTPDGETPAQETVCDELKGATPGLYGLCVAFCEAQDWDMADCDVANDPESCIPKSGPRILSKYNAKKKAGDPDMPCLVSASACPCWDGSDGSILPGVVGLGAVWEQLLADGSELAGFELSCAEGFNDRCFDFEFPGGQVSNANCFTFGFPGFVSTMGFQDSTQTMGFCRAHSQMGSPPTTVSSSFNLVDPATAAACLAEHDAFAPSNTFGDPPLDDCGLPTPQ